MEGQISIPVMPDGQAAFPERRRLALLVGVDFAPASNKPPLEHAEEDVRLLAEALKQHCGFGSEQVRELVGSEATSVGVLTALAEYIETCHDDDFLLFSFSGHGITSRHSENSDDDDVYLATADFSPAVARLQPGAHLSLKNLRALLYERCPAGKVLVILDCCYAGDHIRHGPDLEREALLQHVMRYFDITVKSSTANPDALHFTLAAATFGKEAYELHGHGPLLYWLLPALRGEADGAIDNQDRVTFESLQPYLRDAMRPNPPSYSGGSAGRECILAYHRKRATPSAPQSYFPYEPDPLFRAREGEFEALEPLLRTRGEYPLRLGLVGMGGVGKSQLARELVWRTRAHFTDGVFWTATAPEEQMTERTSTLVYALAELASNAQYLPPDEDRAHPSEELRARHLCRYLAQHPDALLVLDNLEHPGQALEELPRLAGTALRCAVLYTSHEPFPSASVIEYRVSPLTKSDDILYVLLHGTREHVLAVNARGERDAELAAAYSICKRVGDLPLALRLLRTQLEQNRWLTLVELDDELRASGVLAIALDERDIKHSLRATFELGWQRVTDEQARRMFLLAACFPEALPIPLWLLALACDLPADYRVQSPLSQARRVLSRLSLIEDVTRDEIQMHPLLREFGREHVSEQERSLAAARICAAFEDVQRLEQRARQSGYWQCLIQLRVARSYLAVLEPGMEICLQRVERRLDREAHLLANSGLWPDRLPGLFYQQMYNRLVEEEQTLPVQPPADVRWLRQMERLGIPDDGSLRTFSGHSNSVNSVVFSPDGSKVLTGSDDTTARIFDAASGETLHVLRGHRKGIRSVAYISGGRQVLTVSHDNAVRLWDAQRGECVSVFEVPFTLEIADEPIAACSPDGRLILTIADEFTLRLWERDSCSLCATCNLQYEMAFQGSLLTIDEEPDLDYVHVITCATFSPDATHIALSSKDGKVFLWNYQEGTLRLIHDFQYYISTLAYTPAGDGLLISLPLGNLALWICASEAFVWETGSGSSVGLSLAFSHDSAGAYFLSSSYFSLVYLWETRTGKQLATSQESFSMLRSIAFSPDDTHILLGLDDTTARLWERTALFPAQDAYLNRARKQTGTRSSFYHASFSPDGTLLAIDEANMQLWNIQSRQVLLNRKGEFLIYTSDLIFSPESKRTINIASNNTIEVFDGSDGRLLRTIVLQSREEYSFTEVTFSPDGRRLLGGASSIGDACLWNTTNGRVLNVLTGHTDKVVCTAFAPDGRRFATGSRDGTTLLWTQHGNTYTKVLLPGHGGLVHTVAFSPDGTKVFTGAGDSLVRAWDATSGALLTTLDGKMSEPRLIVCSPDNTMVLVGDMFNQVRIWRIDGGYELVGAFATHGRVLAAYWHDARTVWLVDNTATDGFPYMYTLHF